MKHLSDLEAAEVSLVTRGANKRKFLVFKGREGNSMDKEMQKLIREADPKALAEVEKVIKAYCDMEKNEDKKTVLSDRAQAALKAAARILTPFKKELDKDLLKKVMGAAGMQMSGEEENDTTAEERMENSLTKEQATQSPSPIKAEHEAIAMKAAKAAFQTSLQKLGYQKYPEGKVTNKSFAGDTDGADAETEEDETVSKQAVVKADGSLDLEAVPESVRPVVEAIYKGQQELVKKNAALEKELADTKSAHREKELVAKAESYTHLGSKDDVLATLKDADKLGAEAFSRITKQFDSMQAQAESSAAFQEIGSNQPRGGATTWEMIEKAALGLVEKSGDQGMTKEQAVEKFLLTPAGQRLYTDYQRETGRG